ncbi:MAG: GtrA family protein [Archangium sp.]
MQTEAGMSVPVHPRGLLAQFVRYLFVGGTAFIVDFTTLAVLKESGALGVLGAAALAFLVGTQVNYFLSTRWVFTSRRVKNRRLEFALFAAVGLAGLCLNELILWMLNHRLGVHYLLAKLASAGLVLGWNFSVRRLTLFRG